MAPTEINAEVLTKLAADGIGGRCVVVQRDGGSPAFADAVAALGPGELVDVPVYRWSLPDDPGPARRLLDAIADGQLDAVTFTCAVAVHHAFEMAADTAALVAAFDADVLAVAVGPVTAEALRDRGVGRLLQPARARLGSMVHALVEWLEDRATVLRHGPWPVRWQGLALLAADGSETELAELTRGEARLLSILVRRAPTVVPKTSLVEHGSDDHAAEAAVARLRAKLGPLGAGIRTVRRRGYACDLAIETRSGRLP
jgi:uroporphyrinogen-III synthase